ncbi:Alcohol dehydrogenase [NADP(+)] [Blomia tropicalis]|nr:Alcohol dehydrogenase [NADP(+)] [Blomia tropicalis]
MVDPKSVPRYTFNDGNTVPFVGLGTWQSQPDGSVYRAVRHALASGYRHLDCAFIYQNQDEIGRAITDSIKEGVLTREELFVTSKIWLTHYSKERVEICAKKILSDLQLTQIDLLLLHWPFTFKQQDDNLFPVDSDGSVIGGDVGFVEAYKALEELQKQGLVKSIGVSNFNISQLTRLMENTSVKPVTNQVELHPYLVQKELKEFCNKNGIVLTAYSPLGNPGSAVNTAADKDKLLKDPVVNKLATKYGKNAGQILIKFQVASGNLVIPKSVTKRELNRIFKSLTLILLQKKLLNCLPWIAIIVHQNLNLKLSITFSDELS